MSLRGIRGATTVNENQASEILAATRELLKAILSANPGVKLSDLSTVWFTCTHDLDAAYPAQAARELGWTQVPLMCACEIPVPGSLPRCIRVLLQWNTDQPQDSIRHVYLRDAISLRPDLNG
jgi:chorismate mutase